MKQFFSISILILLASCNNIACSQSDLAKKVMLNLQSDSNDWYEELIVEKVIPYAKNESIIVLPEFTDYADNYFSLKTWIVVVENLTGKIKSKTVVFVDSDAVVFTGFTIDTAPYQISKDTRAFGIRSKYRGSSNVNPYNYESISLYIKQDDTLKTILTDFIIKQYHGDWDTQCAGEFTNQDKLLLLTKNMTNGCFDLLVKNEIVVENYFVNEQGECESREEKTVEKDTLQFRNGQYSLKNLPEWNEDKSKSIELGYADTYDSLPKLHFDIISESDFDKVHFEYSFTKPELKNKGVNFFVTTSSMEHNFKKYDDYGGDEGFSGYEFIGYYPQLKLYALTENSTSESLGFGELFLLDSLSDYTYKIISFGDGSVSAPIPSPSNKYLVYYDNSVYEHKNCNIGILKVNSKSSPKSYLTEYASYYSDEFAIEQLIWASDNTILIKGYEEVYENEEWVKYFKYYKANLK